MYHLPQFKIKVFVDFSKVLITKNETEIPKREDLMKCTVFCSIPCIYQLFYSPSFYWSKWSDLVEMAQRGQVIPSMLSSALEPKPGCPFLFCHIPISHFGQFIRRSLTAGCPTSICCHNFPTPQTCLPLSPRLHKGICSPFVPAKGPHGCGPLTCTFLYYVCISRRLHLSETFLIFSQCLYSSLLVANITQVSLKQFTNVAHKPTRKFKPM